MFFGLLTKLRVIHICPFHTVRKTMWSIGEGRRRVQIGVEIFSLPSLIINSFLLSFFFHIHKIGLGFLTCGDFMFLHIVLAA